MKLTSLALIAVTLLAAVARGELPPFVEQDLLPAVDDRPTCACVVEGDPGGAGAGEARESDFLVVGYAGGYLTGFQRVGGRSARPSPVALPGRGPVASVAGVRFPGGAGTGMNHAILAAQGRTVSAVSFERGEAMGSCQLPPPAGAYRLAALGIARALAYDDASAWMLSLEGTSEGWSIRAESALSSADGLRVTVSREGSVTALAGGRTYDVSHTGLHALGDLPLGGLDTAGPLVCTERLAAGRDINAPGALRLLVRADDGSWGAGSVPLPGPLTMLVAVSDSTVLAGGAAPDTATGWVEIVDRRGVVSATGAHAVPPVHACVMDGCFVVHGEDGNLSVFGPTLESLWDEASRFITPVALLALDYDGDGFDDAALIGERLVVSRRAETDSLRRFLKTPDIMAGARLVRDPVTGVERYEREETHAEVLLSRRALLERLSGDREREGREALGAGDDERAIELLSESRAAAAAVGDRDRVAGITKTLGEWTSRGRRTRATVLLALVLAAAGLFYALGFARGVIRAGVTVACGVALCAVAVLGWRLFGFLAWTPLLAVGGLAPLGAVLLRTLRLQGGAAPHPTAPIDELREAVAQLRHAVDDDLRAVGRVVTDAPRKNVTALAALTEDMRRSLDDPAQYGALLERLRARGETFRTIVAPHLERIAWLSRQARFVTEDARLMHMTGARIASALEIVLGGSTDRSALDAELRAVPEARRELVAAVERAWNEIEANPGCSIVSVFEYVAREKKDEIAGFGAVLTRRFDVGAGRDAVRMRHGELYFVIENLFTNALRAMETAKRREIGVQIRSDGVTCTVRFADTGAGMTPERAAEIMRQREGAPGGGGTGMPGTLRIVRRYGGDLVVERTQVGEGTTFLLAIPHWSPAASAPGPGGEN